MRKTLIIIASILLTTYCSASNIKNEAQRFMEILYYIDMMYVDTANIEQLTTSAITKMLAELDPHSQYIPADEVEAMNEHIQGKFEGVGISYNIINDTLTVIDVISGGPSEKVGILPGDRITHVNDTSINGKNAKRSEIQRRLRGKKGSIVDVTVVRTGNNENLTFNITRDIIPLHSVDAAYIIRDNIGYIKLNSFSQTTIQEFRQAVSKLQNQGMTHLILDLQSNGGGLLHASIALVDQFLSNGKLIVYTEGENQRRQDALSNYGGLLENQEITILIDEFSASASEITAGAIQDWDRGTVIGRRSFGKGLVQRPIKLSDGSELRLTTARYYTPSGRNIQRPYTKGKENYYKELERRYAHGEFQHADSISFPDSLKYKTLNKKRTVYGGGGIFPDIFVPLDTTQLTTYYRELISKGIIISITSAHLDKHRKEIKTKYPTAKSFIENWEVPQQLLDAMVSQGENKNIEYNKKQYKQSLPLINIQLKALIARGIYNQETFYKIFNQSNQILLNALQIIETKNK